MTTIQIEFIITFTPLLFMVFVMLLDGYYNGNESEM
jgi:hypothetical protein